MKHYYSRRYNRKKKILHSIIEQAANHFNAYKIKNKLNNSEDNYKGLGHRELKRKTEQALNQTFSPGTFDKYLDILVANRKFTIHKRHARGGKAEYRLTEQALQELQAGVLQIHGVEPALEVFADEEERHRLYHLLFTIETLEPPFLDEIYDTEEGMLKRINKLFEVSIFPEDLVPQSIQRKEVNCTVTYYKPVSCIHIAKEVFHEDRGHAQLLDAASATTTTATSCSSPYPSSQAHLQKQQQQQQPAFYNVKTMGFSVSDIMNYERKFGFVRLDDLTKSKVKSSIRLLTKAKIIAAIGKLKGETRYAFADESLRQVIGRCLVIFNHTMQLLLSKVWQYERKVNREERDWLEKLYGKKQAERIISDNYDFLTTMGQESIVAVRESYNTEKKVLYRLVKKEVEELKQNYAGSIMRQYPFPLSHIIEDMIFPHFLEKSLGIYKSKKSNTMMNAQQRCQ